MFCKCCGGKPEPGKQWCKDKACQAHKVRHQRDSKARHHKASNPTAVKDGKLNGRFCQHLGQNDLPDCKVPLRGWNFFMCPCHQKTADGYSLQTNVCM